MNLIETYDKLNPIFCPFGKIYIAGGAVRDYLMGKEPKDYDLFILGDGRWNDVHPDVNNAIVAHGLKEIKSDLEFHKSEPFLLSEVELDNKRVQIMFRNNIENIDGLLDTFDWNVSLFGYGSGGFIQREKLENIGQGKELWLQNITYPGSSLRRGYRFSERFGMYIRKSDLHRLCWLVSKKQEKENIDYII